MSDLWFKPAHELAALIRSRQLSPVELLEASLQRIEETEPTLNAWTGMRREEAMQEARDIGERIARGEEVGPLAGLPFGVKELDDLAGFPSTHASLPYKDDYPERDSIEVERLRKAGAIALGKTNAPEFGYTASTKNLIFGVTRNPWNPERTPGGSSGGSSAAVAAGQVPFCTASDGGGSIRIPASCCGVFGLKPSRGRVSSAPFAALEGLSTAGPLSRTVEDAAHLLDALAGYEPGDPWWAPPPEHPFASTVAEPPGTLRVAVTSTPPIETPVAPECVAALASAAGLLTELGHEVVEATPPWTDPDLFHTFIEVWQAGPALHPIDDLSLMTALNRGLVESARASCTIDYARAVARLQAIARRTVAFWQEVDVVFTPTLAMPPVPIGWQESVEGAIEQLLRNTEFTPFTAIANLTGLPAMSLPLHWSEDGLPIGVHAIGPPAGDAVLLSLAAQLEAARPWADRRPPIG